MQRHYWMAAAILTAIGSSLVAGLVHSATESAAIAAPTGYAEEREAESAPARYVSLRYNEINGRRGPSLDQPILWVYQRSGLPVEVLERTPGWWQVRDPDGAQVWIAERMFDERRTVIVSGIAGEGVALRRQPLDDSDVLAFAERGVVFALDRCMDGWCRLDGARASGWAPAAALWGLTEDERG